MKGSRIQSCLRWTIRTAVLGITLLVLGVALLNHWAAGERREAVERFQAAGNRIGVSDFQVVIPPDDENFAMIPLLRELWEEEAEGEMTGVAAKMFAMARSPDGSLMSQKGNLLDDREELARFGISGAAEEMLAQYDERHQAVLEGLRAGLDRPHAVMPRSFDLAEPRHAYGSWGLGHRINVFMPAALGLRLRAELAVAAEREDVAFETVKMIRNLSDLSFSHGSISGGFIAWNLDGFAARPLKLGIEAGLWDRKSLGELERLWSQRDTLAGMNEMLNADCVAMSVLLEHATRDRDLWVELTKVENQRVWYLLPDAWFDMDSVNLLEEGGKWLALFRTEPRLEVWWKAMEESHSRQSDALGKVFGITGFGEGRLCAALVRVGVRAMVRDAMAIVACRLEIHRLREGRYPAELVELGGEGVLDPLNGGPFAYRREGEGFVLYSVGPDGVDDGGVCETVGYSAPDWVWGDW